MENILDIILLIIIIVWVVIYIMGPSSRYDTEVIQYDTLIKLINDGKIKLKLKNHRIAEEIASSPIYPKSEFKTYRLKTCIFRIIFVIYLSILWALPTVGPTEVIIAIIIRAAALRNLSNLVVHVALGNKQVYEIISTIGGWKYDGVRVIC